MAVSPPPLPRWGWYALAAVLTLAGALGAWWVLQQGLLTWLLTWLLSVNRWLADHLIERLGYLGVFALMFIESSFIPFPSEIVMPPAGDLARRLPDWTLGGVITAGVLGSLAGALLNYALARYVGRRILLHFIQRYGRFVRISLPGYLAAETRFARHGAISTFTGRLIPGIRQLISLPAGLARMNLLAFCLLTSLGASLWVGMLAGAGYWFGGRAETLEAALKKYSFLLIGAALLLIMVYIGFRLVSHRVRQ